MVLEAETGQAAKLHDGFLRWQSDCLSAGKTNKPFLQAAAQTARFAASGVSASVKARRFEIDRYPVRAAWPPDTCVSIHSSLDRCIGQLRTLFGQLEPNGSGRRGSMDFVRDALADGGLQEPRCSKSLQLHRRRDQTFKEHASTVSDSTTMITPNYLIRLMFINSPFPSGCIDP